MTAWLGGFFIGVGTTIAVIAWLIRDWKLGPPRG